MDGVAVLLLGPVAARIAGARVELGPPRRRAVLAALAVHEGPLTVSRLVGLLWAGVPPPTAPTMVHGAVAGLRRVLGAGAVVTRDGAYALDEVETDLRRVERLVATGRTARPAEAVGLLAEALALWRGPALEGLDEPFARSAADRLDGLRLECVERWAQAALAAGQHDDVAAALERQVADHPLRERFTELLMVALYRAGRQADALAAGRRLRRRLVAELGVEPGPDVRRTELAILHHEDAGPARRHGPAAVGPLRRPDRFVGRLRERAEVAGLLGTHRLVSLTGPGGTGKTRLALEVAAQHPGEVVVVDLVVMTGTGRTVTDAVAGALGVRPEPGVPLDVTVAAALAGRDVLLVVDNCEHVVEDCAETVGTLLAASTVRVLATGREALAIPGERVYPLAPLSCAGPGSVLREIRRCDAVRLFELRAAAARPGFAVDADNAAAVLDVCRRLDGLPLAIELAAARVTAIPVQDLAERLDERFRLLDGTLRGVPARHRTLAATVAWSTDLLSPAERTLFGRLGVFPADFDLAAAEAVAAGPGLPPAAVAAAIARLVAGSVLELARDGRYRMLATTRAFARALTSAGAGDPDAGAARRHARHYTAFASAVEPRLLRGGSGPWLRRLDDEAANLRAALDWAFGPVGDPDTGVALVEALWHHWDLRGSRAEGLRWTAAALAVVEDPAARLPLLSAAALLHVGRAEFGAAEVVVREQLDIARRCGHRAWEGDALGMAATAAWARGAHDRARQLYEDAIAASSAGGDVWRASLKEAQLARLHRDRGEPDAAHAAAQRAGALADEVGEDLARGLALDVRAGLEERWGDAGVAGELVRRALGHYRAVGYREGEASALQLSARLALASGDRTTARRAFDRALRLHRRIGHRAGVAAVHEDLAVVEAGTVRADEHRAVAAALRAEIGLPPAVGGWTRVGIRPAER